MRVCQGRITEDIPFQCEPTCPADTASIGRAFYRRFKRLRNSFHIKNEKPAGHLWGPARRMCIGRHIVVPSMYEHGNSGHNTLDTLTSRCRSSTQNGPDDVGAIRHILLRLFSPEARQRFRVET